MKRTFTFLMMSLFLCVGMVKADVTDLPQITTDLENPIYYTIYNTRSSQPGGLMYYAGDAVGLKDGCSSFGNEYKFFFTGSHDALYIHNAATTNKLASVNSWTAEGTEWAVGVSPKGNGLAIGPKGGLDSNACINEKNYETNESTSDFTTWSANDDGSVFVMELAEGYVFPMTDMFYVIECPLFEKVQGVKKALYVNADGAAAWATEDLSNHNFYWVPTVNEDGTVALKNLGTNKYLSNTAGTMSADAVYATINALGAKSFNIKFDGNALHANGHSNGNGASGGLTNWGGAAGSASAWQFVQREDPTKLQEAVVTYNFTYGDEVKYTQTVTTLVGEAWPAIDVVFPLTVSAAKPEGVIAEEDLTEGAVTKEIALTVAELPFEVGAWYYVKMHTNNRMYIEENVDGTIDWAKTELDEAETLVWSFVGDIWNGFNLVNKGTGHAVVSTSGAAQMGDAANATAFVLSASSTGVEGGFCLMYPENKKYLNASSGKVGEWHDNDPGSTFLLEVYVDPAYDLSDVREAFEAQAVEYMNFLYTLNNLPALSAQCNEVFVTVEALYTAINNGEQVLKADVEAAMESMTTTQAEAALVVNYYTDNCHNTLWDAKDLLATLTPKSDAYVALDAAIQEAEAIIAAAVLVEELEGAVAVLNDTMTNLPEDIITNYTDAIVNADLSTGEGWNTDGTKGISGGMVKVASESAFDFSQTITLPAGQYKMTAKAVYRYTGSEAEEFAAIEAGTKTRLVNLYAETATYKYEADVMNRYDGASDTDYAAGNGSTTVNGKFVPNSSSAVQTWFDNGQYVNELVFNVQEEGQVKIGLTRTGSIAGDYTNIGAWTLTRLGDAEADPTPEPEPEPEPDPTPDPEEPEVDADYDLTEGTWSDATSYIVNADFASIEGWTVAVDHVGESYGGTYYKLDTGTDPNTIEVYHTWGGTSTPLDQTKNFKFSQKVMLPSGIYCLKANGFYREGAEQNATTEKAWLFAGESTQNLVGIGTCGANSMTDAANVFKNGGCLNEFTFTVVEDGEVELGFQGYINTTLSWVILGPVTLEKKVTLKDNFMEQAAAFSAFGQSSMALYSLGAVQEKWAEAMAVVEPLYTAVTENEKVLKADVVAAMELMTATMAEIEPVVEYYDGKYTDTKWAMYDIQDNSTANSDEVRTAFDDALTAALNVYTVTTVAELEAKVAEMEAARQTYVQNAVPAEGFSFDYTFKIVNAQVASADGWTNGNTATGEAYDNAPDGQYLDWCNWSGKVATFNMYQELTGLPSGVYTLKAATRSDSRMDGHIYANDSTAAIHNVGNSGNELGRGWGWTTVEEIIIIDGKMTVGFTGTAQVNGVWAGADNFTLAYTGALPESVLLDLKKEAFIERYNKFEMLAEGLDYSWNAINNNYYFPVQEAAWAVKEGIAEVTDMATLDTHMTAMDEAEVALNAAYAAGAVYNTYKNLLWDASDNSTAVSQEIADMKDAALENSNYAGYTLASTEAIEAATAELKAVYETYALNAYALNGYMFDVTFLIANAAVASAEGWTNAEGRIINNTEYTGAPDKAAFDAGWWAGVIDIHQELPELPAGNYVLSAVARSASPDSYIYAKSGETEVKTTLPQNGDQGGEFGNGWATVTADTINVAEGNTLTVGVYINNPGANFAAADNFKLYYGGADTAPLYDLSEVRDAFEAQAMEFMSFGQGSMALYQLSALHAQYNEVMMEVEALYSAINNEEKVLKSDVVAAMDAMTTTKSAIEPVLAYYTESYSVVYYGADDLLQSLDPASEEYAALDAVLGQVWDLSEVTTVEELEAKAAIIEEGVAPFYDLTEVRDAFEAQAMEFMSFGQGSMALYQLSALHAQYNEVMMEVEALYSAIYNEEKVLKSDVVAAMDAMTTTKSAIEPVLAYYTESYSVVYYGADDLLQTLDPASEKYAILDAALGQVWDLSEVTTVAELEAKAAIINKAMSDIETGIDNVIVDEEVVIYDLSGRRVTEMKKGGIYIVNGKKVINK